ncbi:hypothetical protein D3C77_392090 [compost metagenome]
MCAISDQPPGRNKELQTNLARATVNHIDHFRFARAETLHDRSHMFLRDINEQALDWFHFDAIDFLYHDFRLGNLKLIAFSAHIFDQNAQMKLTAARYDEGIRTIRLIHAQGDIGL